MAKIIFTTTEGIRIAVIVLAVLFAGAPLVIHASGGCPCVSVTETLVSDQTNTIGGGFAVPVATSSAWTASIPGASWIWQASSTVPNAVVPFEKSFTVVGTVLSAQLFIAADNSYKVFIDGVQVAADSSATNFTLATQDVYNLTANVTPGTHILRIEVKNNGTFNATSNPAGLLYKFEIQTCPPPALVTFNGIRIVTCNGGTIINRTPALANTGSNAAGGSQGGNGSAGGTITANGSNNNGGASSGGGGSGGTGKRGGVVVTGNATSNATTTNILNRTEVNVRR